MTTVGVRELKSRLSEFLRRASEGERVVVTDRGRPLALISRPDESGLDPHLRSLLKQGRLRWGGGKPRGSPRPVRLRKGPTMAETVIEGRR
jgi:antitoxin (DNA-binding transcriptional repressor) of toxin-antitoxin stability system